MARVASRPSITGICTSISTNGRGAAPSIRNGFRPIDRQTDVVAHLLQHAQGDLLWLTGWSPTRRMSSAGSRRGPDGRCVPVGDTGTIAGPAGQNLLQAVQQVRRRHRLDQPGTDAARRTTRRRCAARAQGSSITVRPGGAAAAAWPASPRSPTGRALPASSTSASKGGAASRRARPGVRPDHGRRPYPHAPAGSQASRAGVALSSANTRRPCGEPLPDGRTLASAPPARPRAPSAQSGPDRPRWTG